MTFDELVSAVCDDLNRSDLTAQASDAVSMAIRQYDHRGWWFHETSHTFSTTASTAVYPLPADFRSMDLVRIRQPGGDWQEVIPASFSAVQRMLEASATTGYPDYYAIYNSELYLGVAPNGGYEARLYYRRGLGEMSGGASNAWTTDAQDLIRAAAAKTVAIRKLHDPELASMFGSVESSEYVRLLAENDKRVSTGRSVPC
jgi:hypothetical protein